MKKWELISESILQLGYRKVAKRIYELPNGKTSKYDVLISTDTALMFCITSDQKVILVKQFRPGPGKVTIEIPAGFCDEGELPESAAARELLEETGYAGNVQLLNTTHATAYSIHQRHLFLITDCKKVQESGTDELIEVELVDLDTVVGILRKDESAHLLFALESISQYKRLRRKSVPVY
jgi:ADP-ribose pyrophosphatase